jgi:uncharacterized membrane protein
VVSTTQPEATIESADSPRNALWWLLLITLGALALRLYRLGQRPFWLDEAYSLQITDQPISSIWSWTNPAAPVDPPLYFVALRAWRLAFGDAEAAVRSLSVLFGVTLIPATYWLGAQLRSKATGLLAAGLVALAALQIDHAQTARMYGLLALAVTVATAGTVQLMRAKGGRWWVWAGLVAGSAAALLTHAYGVFYVAGLVVAPVWIYRRELMSPFMRRWWIAQGVVLALWATWIPALPGQFASYLRLAPSAFEDPNPLDIARNLFTTVATGVSALLRTTAASQVLSVVLGLILLYIGIRGIGSLAREPKAVALGELALGVGVPIVLTLLVGPLVLGRTLVPAGVLALALLAAGAMSWEGRMRWLITASLIGLLAVGGIYYSIYGDNDPWDQAAAFVEAEAGPDDVVVFIYADGILPFELYYEPQGVGPTLLPVADADIPRLGELTRGVERVLLVRSHTPIHDTEGEAPIILGRLRPQEQMQDLSGITIYVFGPEG